MKKFLGSKKGMAVGTGGLITGLIFDELLLRPLVSKIKKANFGKGNENGKNKKGTTGSTEKGGGGLLKKPMLWITTTVVAGLGGLLLFFVLFLGVVRNPNVPYFVRFNALQALLIDIARIVLNIGFQLLLGPLAAGVAESLE